MTTPAQHRAALADRVASRWDALSLRTKITGVTVLLLSAGLVVAGFGTMAVLRGYLVEQTDRQLSTALANLGLEDGISLDDAQQYFEEKSPLTPYYLGLVGAGGTVVADNYGDETQRRPDWASVDLDAASSRTVAVTERSVDHEVQWRLLLKPVVISSSGADATLVIGADLTEADATVNRFGAVFLFFALTVVILGGALTRLLATATFAPLRRLEDQAARFAGGDYNQRLDQAPPNTEVGRLTRSLNAMLARIDAALADRTRTIEQMRRFVGDASHELRTPLVTVRGYAELYRMGALATPEDVAGAMDRIEREAKRMGGLVEDLLELARLDAAASGANAKPPAPTDVDLVPIAQDAARDAMASAQDRVVGVVALDPGSLGAPVRAAMPADTPATPMPIPEAVDTRTRQIPIQPPAEAPPTDGRTRPIQIFSRLIGGLRRPAASTSAAAEPEPLPAPPPDLRAVVRGEEDKIRQVVANLVTNAIRYSPEGSPLELGVGVDAAGRRGVIAVIDHGPGIPPEIRDKIFQRFWRADTSRARETGGNGLGLAIVAAIVQAHRGTVDVTDTPGGGATFRVWLPLA